MNRAEHAMGAAVAIGAVSLVFSGDKGSSTENRSISALASSTLAALLGSLPDWVEPATDPNHRQFFHSVAFGLAVGRGVVELHRWQPDDDLGRALRFVGLVAGGAYLTHLVMDATTQKSIPLI